MSPQAAPAGSPGLEKVVEIPGVGNVAFPSSMTDAQINAAASKLYHESNRGQAKPQKQSWISRATTWVPSVTGAVGGIVGGPVGAAAGGAAGKGIQQAVEQAGEIGPAIRDVASNVTAGYGKASASGFAKGAAEGTVAAGKEAAIQGAAEGVGSAVGQGLKAAGPWLMQKALKPTATMLKEYGTTASELATTLLREGVNVTEGGVAKLQRLFEATNQDIAAAVAGAKGQIGKKSVAARALTTANRLAQQTNPAKDLKAVGETVSEFLDHPVYSGPTLTVPEAQAMKIGTYRQIGKKYGEVSSAEIETQKSLARGLKEEIADEVPGIAGLNTRDSELMAALDAVGRRAALAGNRDPVGFAWVAQHPATFLAALFDRSPMVKSLVARGAYRSAGKAARVSPQLIRSAVVALASAEPPVEPVSPLPPASGGK